MASSDYVAEANGPYLTGPMVIRVYPDGRPVPDDEKHPLPRDEDMDELRYARLPSVKEIEDKSGNIFYNRKDTSMESATIKARRSSFDIIPADRDQPMQEARRFRGGKPLLYERTMLRSSLMNKRGIRYH